LVESTGTPVICSDIAIFREIAESDATFVKIDDPAELARDIVGWPTASAAKLANRLGG